jgi:hypothetical protein
VNIAIDLKRHQRLKASPFQAHSEIPKGTPWNQQHGMIDAAQIREATWKSTQSMALPEPSLPRINFLFRSGTQAH